jgi:hypothetical protein
VALEVFQLCYFEDLGAIVCTFHTGGCAIPADSLLKHLSNNHGSDLQLNDGRVLLFKIEWNEIVHHILYAHQIDSQKSSEVVQKGLPSRISKPTRVNGGV